MCWNVSVIYTELNICSYVSCVFVDGFQKVCFTNEVLHRYM